MANIKKENKLYVVEWAVEISWNDGETCWLRDTHLFKETMEKVNRNIDSIWQNAINKETLMNQDLTEEDWEAYQLSVNM